MSKVSVYNMQGAQVGELELNDAVFGVEVNEHLVKMAVTSQLANNRQGTQNAKTRSEVAGGGRKPCRQKGTGPARNLKNIKTASTNTINVYDILKYDTVVATKAAVATIVEVYA